MELYNFIQCPRLDLTKVYITFYKIFYNNSVFLTDFGQHFHNVPVASNCAAQSKSLTVGGGDVNCGNAGFCGEKRELGEKIQSKAKTPPTYSACMTLSL